MLEIYPVGGYNEVGRNMTLIKSGDDAVIIDMGLQLERYIKLTEDLETAELTTGKLHDAGAIPDDSKIKELAKYVKAICPSHGHLDHIGALPYLAKKYNVPIVATPYTIEVIKSISEDSSRKINNELITIELNGTYEISKDFKVEFINMTHSIPHTATIAVHTKDGIVIYTNDFKLDNTPTLGDKPNYKRLKELGKQGVKVLFADGVRSRQPNKTPSEKIARELLKDTFDSLPKNKNALFVTTFSSQIARLKSIIELSQKLNRKIVFLGRSLNKYATAAHNINLVNFGEKVELVKYGNQVKRKLREINENREKYLVVLTGHQGEPHAVLSRIVDGHLPFNFKRGDVVIFSCTVIPVAMNIILRKKLDIDLIKQGVRLYKDIHASGHGSKEDVREMIELVKPEHIVPSHGNHELIDPVADLAKEMGYADDKIHLLSDGKVFNVK